MRSALASEGLNGATDPAQQVRNRVRAALQVSLSSTTINQAWAHLWEDWLRRPSERDKTCSELWAMFNLRGLDGPKGKSSPMIGNGIGDSLFAVTTRDYEDQARHLSTIGRKHGNTLVRSTMRLNAAKSVALHDKRSFASRGWRTKCESWSARKRRSHSRLNCSTLELSFGRAKESWDRYCSSPSFGHGMPANRSKIGSARSSIAILDGFEGKLTSSKWAALAKCSQHTASRAEHELFARKCRMNNRDDFPEE